MLEKHIVLMSSASNTAKNIAHHEFVNIGAESINYLKLRVVLVNLTYTASSR